MNHAQRYCELLQPKWKYPLKAFCWYSLLAIELRVFESDLSKVSPLIIKIGQFLRTIENRGNKRLRYVRLALKSLINSIQTRREELEEGLEIIPMPFLPKKNQQEYLHILSETNFGKVSPNGISKAINVYTFWDNIIVALELMKDPLSKADEFFLMAMDANLKRDPLRERQYLLKARDLYITGQTKHYFHKSKHNTFMYAKVCYLIATSAAELKVNMPTSAEWFSKLEFEEIHHLKSCYQAAKVLGTRMLQIAAAQRLGWPIPVDPKFQKFLPQDTGNPSPHHR